MTTRRARPATRHPEPIAAGPWRGGRPASTTAPAVTATHARPATSRRGAAAPARGRPRAGAAADVDHEALAAILDAAGVAVVTQTSDGVITGWNAAADHLYGWGPETVGRTVYDVSPAEEWPSIRSSTARAAAGERVGPFDIERTYRGRRIFLSVSIVPVRDPSGSVTGIATLARDVTETHLILEQQARAADTMAEARHAAEMGRLVGGLAHEVNNLLAAIRGHADELRGALATGSPERGSADRILAAADEAASVLRGLIAAAGRQVLDEAPIELGELVTALLPRMRSAFGSGVDLEVVPAERPLHVLGDRSQLTEALRALLLRARDASRPGGGVRLVLRAAERRRGDRTDPGRRREAVVEIVDEGRRLEPPELDAFFEPFRPGDASGRARTLRVAAARGIVRQLHGTVTVRSGDAGTTVTVRLPRVARDGALEVRATGRAAVGPAAGAVPTDEPPRGHGAAAPPGIAPRGAAPVTGATPGGRPTDGGSDGEPPRDDACTGLRGGSILLVDDDRVVRALTAHMLRAGGHRVVEAGDAGTALALGADHELELDLLVTDVIMPGLRGPELAARLRDLRPGLPVLFISGYAEDELPPGALDARTRFLGKPFPPATLLRRVAELLPAPAPAGGPASPRPRGPARHAIEAPAAG